MDEIKVDRDEARAARNVLEEGEGRGGRMLVVLLLIAAALTAGVWYWWQSQEAEPLPASVEVPPVAVAQPIAPAPPEEEKPVENPVEPPPAPAPLPALDESDGPFSAAIKELTGQKSFAALFVPESLIRHIVATVDNLPRQQAPVKVWPLRPVGSWLETTGNDETLAIAPKNAARYAPYVKLVRGIDAPRLAMAYRRFYPLFQDAYRELGYPKGYFNDRLIVAIDDLLATPEPSGPLQLVPAKVRYEFADPDLASRSAGQKILLRMGVDNARTVKAKLREFRQYVAKRPQGQP